MHEEQPTFEEKYPELEVEKPKIYNLPSIIIGSLLGGPLVTAYMMAENYKAFDRRDLVLKTWIFIILFFGILTFGIYFIMLHFLQNYPIIFEIVRFLIVPLLLILPVSKLQMEQISDYLSNGGESFRLIRAIFIGLLMLFIDFVILNILIGIFMTFFMVNG